MCHAFERASGFYHYHHTDTLAVMWWYLLSFLCQIVYRGYYTSRMLKEITFQELKTEKHWEEKDSKLRDWCWVHPGAEQTLLDAMRRVLQPE